MSAMMKRQREQRVSRKGLGAEFIEKVYRSLTS
jgi:hypothetical protein